MCVFLSWAVLCSSCFLVPTSCPPLRGYDPYFLVPSSYPPVPFGMGEQPDKRRGGLWYLGIQALASPAEYTLTTSVYLPPTRSPVVSTHASSGPLLSSCSALLVDARSSRCGGTTKEEAPHAARSSGVVCSRFDRYCLIPDRYACNCSGYCNSSCGAASCRVGACTRTPLLSSRSCNSN